ncbi:MAG: type II secretion system F family protein [Deltaproteobacteria bacterium]|nr:type II secretion system F family protein [Deltaproteobacteria bacterium]
MPNFIYTARRPSGEQVTGELDLTSSDAVAAQLTENGLIPIRIQQGVSRPAKKGKSLSFSFTKRKKKVGLDDLVLFCRQMFALTRAGVPMMRSLQGLIESSQSASLQEALRGVMENLEAGRDLSGSMASYPEVFPNLMIRMVQVGENSGNLEQSFEQLADYLEFEKMTREQIKAAMRYPSFVIIAIAIAMAILSLFVIPTFEKVFAGFGADLPLPTKIIMGISQFSVAYWPHILAALIATIFAVRRYLKTERGTLQWDRYKLKIPIVGSILLRSTLARFARSFSMGYGSGVPLVQALGFTARAIENAYLGGKLDEMRNHLERGETLTRSAASLEIFTPLVLQMLAVGEETGSVDTMLLEVAGFYEREVQYELKNLTSAIEPILIVVIGGMVLVLALGVFLPMWNLGSMMR